MEKKINKGVMMSILKALGDYADEHKEECAHELKILPEYFAAVKDGSKTFEIRKNDRDYMVGDYILLKEYDKNTGYTGNEILVEITYMITSEQFDGLKDGYCVLGIELLD